MKWYPGDDVVDWWGVMPRFYDASDFNRLRRAFGFERMLRVIASRSADRRGFAIDYRRIRDSSGQARIEESGAGLRARRGDLIWCPKAMVRDGLLERGIHRPRASGGESVQSGRRRLDAELIRGDGPARGSARMHREAAARPRYANSRQRGDAMPGEGRRERLVSSDPHSDRCAPARIRASSHRAKWNHFRAAERGEVT